MSFEVVPTKIMSQVRKLLQISTKLDCWLGVSQDNLCSNHSGPIKFVVEKGTKLLLK